MNIDVIFAILIYALKFVTGGNVSDFPLSNEALIFDNLQNLNRTDIKKSKVKKRPGVPEVPPLPLLPTISPVNTEDTFGFNEKEEEEEESKNSTIVPRKGAGDPPPLPSINSTSEGDTESSMTGSINTPFDKNISSLNSSIAKEVAVNLNESSYEMSPIKPQNATEIKPFMTSNPISLVNSSTSHSIIANTSEKPVSESIFKISTIALEYTIAPDVQNKLNETEPELLVSSSASPLGKPSTASDNEISSKSSSISSIIIAVLVALGVCSLLGFITYKRLHAYWNRRHYSRVDFLIDGLYEM